jgi:cell division protein FtsB
VSAEVVYVLISVLGLVLVLATGAGAYFAFKTSRNAQLVEVYKGTADAWQERASAYADQIKQLQEQDKIKTGQIADLTGQVNMLKDMVTGQRSLDVLNGKVDRVLELIAPGGSHA